MHSDGARSPTYRIYLPEPLFRTPWPFLRARLLSGPAAEAPLDGVLLSRIRRPCRRASDLSRLLVGGPLSVRALFERPRQSYRPCRPQPTAPLSGHIKRASPALQFIRLVHVDLRAVRLLSFGQAFHERLSTEKRWRKAGVPSSRISARVSCVSRKSRSASGSAEVTIQTQYVRLHDRKASKACAASMPTLRTMRNAAIASNIEDPRAGTVRWWLVAQSK
jgi:hypothetical protein